MKITIYELLGLIKDGKAPRKIKYSSYIMIYEIDENDYRTLEQDYYDCDVKTYKWLTDCMDGFTDLNDEVEVIEEDTFEDIEELNVILMNGRDDSDARVSIIQENFIRTTDTINELIRNQKKIISKLEGKENEF